MAQDCSANDQGVREGKTEVRMLFNSMHPIFNDPDSREIPEDCYQWIPPDYTIRKLFEANGKVTKSMWRAA
jgi:hypothetical protein